MAENAAQTVDLRVISCCVVGTTAMTSHTRWLKPSLTVSNPAALSGGPLGLEVRNINNPVWNCKCLFHMRTLRNQLFNDCGSVELRSVVELKTWLDRNLFWDTNICLMTEREQSTCKQETFRLSITVTQRREITWCDFALVFFSSLQDLLLRVKSFINFLKCQAVFQRWRSPNNDSYTQELLPSTSSECINWKIISLIMLHGITMGILLFVAISTLPQWFDEICPTIHAL